MREVYTQILKWGTLRGRGSSVESRMRTTTPETGRFRLSSDTIGILLMLGVLALILATLEWVGDRMRPPPSLEAPAKTSKTVAMLHST